MYPPALPVCLASHGTPPVAPHSSIVIGGANSFSPVFSNFGIAIGSGGIIPALNSLSKQFLKLRKFSLR